ncbi:serine/threonine-protein kinase [Nonomuraea sp. NEAU-A123]|uniref:serine/threonine-protein kinase n=1 Tax=Nonomuraea sp. NEAU-A123 TaxID=2839649 RepID=UPI001BE4A7C3|nr:serine/threonine-protein kinase [Nonomuraea sp. NEAU-A123]MBT2231490.1 serine/threonine protein kinase [Nonomuraea sp. NEAU-A123]
MGPRPLDPDEPERIGDYRLTGVLGQGGQGVVYLGEAASGGRVAIKVLHRSASMDSESRRRFLREADTARRVAPFCTARVLDVGDIHGRPYVVSEYIPGGSLAEAVATDGPRTGSGLQRLAVATLTALTAIHRAGIVHRDFKPGNVILGPEGPVVIDFGIARALDHTTTESGVVGTPAYIAPEQFAGQPPSRASDVFSWACTMAFAATGRLAFGGATIPALLYSVSTRDPDLAGVPGDLRPLLAACLSKDPDARPTAADLLRDLTGSDPHSPPPLPPLPAGPDPSTATLRTAAQETAQGAAGGPGRTRRWIWGVAAGLAAVLVAGVILVPQFRSTHEAPANGPLLYADDFSDRGNWDGYTFSPHAEGDNRTVHGYEIDRGVYSLFADKGYPNNPALSPVPAKNPASPAAVERDVMIGATAEVRAGSSGRGSFGLLCRWDEEVPNGYAFLLGLDGTARVVRNAQGTNLDVTPPVQAGAPTAGQRVRIQAACRRAGTGTHLTLWIDGTQTIDVVDSQTLPVSSISQAGVVARVPEAGGGVITVSFDDFSVHRAQ